MNEPRAGALQNLRLREHQIFLALTIIIGVLAGLAAVLFALAINAVRAALFGMSPSDIRLIVAPTVVSLFTGVLLAKFWSDARGSGVPQTKVAYHLRNGVIHGRVAVGKFLTGALTVGAGHSMGREGPSVQIGAGLASIIGRWVGLPPHRVKDLIPVGAAGALAAAFNTPVAAVLFSLEEIIGDMNASLIGSTVVASVASVVVERSILGNEPLFRVPAYHLVHPAELGAYVLLGVIGGGVSLLFCKGLLQARRIFRRLPAWTVALQPAVGGVMVGVLIICVPEVMGVGYEYVDQALNGGLVLKTMLILCFAKLAATIISYSSGNAGGIFGPALYLGAMIGGAVGIMVNRYAPFPTSEPGAYALVGMGALFAGIIRAPMTSVFMIFEITQDYQILVPLMVANLLSFRISRRYQAAPIYHALLEQDDIHLPSPAGTSQPGWLASDLMTSSFTLLPPETTARTALTFAIQNREHGVLVGSDGRLTGQVPRSLLEEFADVDEPVGPLASVARESPHVHGDHPLEIVLPRLARSTGPLPVLSRTDKNLVEGVITAENVVQRLQCGPAE